MCFFLNQNINSYCWYYLINFVKMLLFWIHKHLSLVVVTLFSINMKFYMHITNNNCSKLVKISWIIKQSLVFSVFIYTVIWSLQHDSNYYKAKIITLPLHNKFSLGMGKFLIYSLTFKTLCFIKITLLLTRTKGTSIKIFRYNNCWGSVLSCSGVYTVP